MKKLTLRILIALLTFVLGVTVTTLWAMGYFYQKEPSVQTELTGIRPKSVPPGWQEVNMEGIVTLYLPADLKQNINLGCTGRTFYNDHMRIGIYYGQCTSGICAVHRNFADIKLSLSKITIDGKSGTLAETGSREFKGVGGGLMSKGLDICLPLAVEGVENITIAADYMEQKDLETINQIIKSIKINVRRV